MSGALILVVVVLMNRYFPKATAIADFCAAKGAALVKIYLEFCLNIFKKITFIKGEFLAILMVLPMVIIVYLLNNVFNLLLKEWGNIIFSTIMLYWCLNSHTEDEHESVLVLAHERTFGIIFWFALLGSSGAMLYWILTMSKAISDPVFTSLTSFQRGLHIMHGLAAWLPARITGLIYALVGDFMQGFNCWSSYMKATSIPSSRVLLDCGQASLTSISGAEEEALVQRALFAWVILGMLIALIIAEVILE